ncbi:hypothetical protein [Streptomyces pakalii]|uniref:Uncharacterized protein n=1 Tax=Streptomyces pakalii TaxID=3036494 RepID=A0ABT7D0G0_9ACTN|nr:hypothetical protein [Streptomyces pakalii]MDJ1639033.1 hypothetical protein [Streptomyces pakalii]
MDETPWVDRLLAVHPALTEADREAIGDWRGTPLSADEEAGDDVPPPTVRLAGLGRAYAGHAPEFSERQAAELFRILEAVPANGDEYGWDAAATGFLEALMNEWDRGFDLAEVWHLTGPRVREYCRAWNRLSGVESPAWMIEG